jgi:tetratricopeptide (TPR) repeat protein
VRYSDGDLATLRRGDVRQIDSLYYRALLRDPFLQRRFDRDLIRRYVLTVMTNPHGGAEQRSLANFYTDAVMGELSPMLRARVMGSEGRLAQALDAYADALRVSGRRNRVPARVIRHERGRLFALAGNDSMALVELGHALDAAVEQDQGDELVWFYESKAMLEHSRGMVHERRGDKAAAREAYARALTEDLSYYPAHLRLGIMAMAEGDTATALAELGLAAQTGSTDVPTRQAYGTLLAALRRLPEAEAELLAVTELAPYYSDAWFLLGMVRDWRGEGDAPGAYRTFLARAPRGHPRRAQAEQAVGTAAP